MKNTMKRVSSSVIWIWSAREKELVTKDFVLGLIIAKITSFQKAQDNSRKNPKEK